VAVLVAAGRAANPALASCGFFYSVARDVFGLSPTGPADVNGAGMPSEAGPREIRGWEPRSVRGGE